MPGTATIFVLIGTLPVAASQWLEFVPDGWKLIGEVQGRNDAVLIVEQDEESNRIPNEGLGPDILNTNPRRIIFLQTSKNSHGKTGSADHFLPPENDKQTPCLVDPLDGGGVQLKSGILTIRLSHWLSCGSYGTSNTSYKFRREGQRYRLIGLDQSSYSRASGQGEEVSINYLTRRKSVTSGVQFLEPEAGEKPSSPKTTWLRIGAQKYYLDAMDRSDCRGYAGVPSWCLGS